MFYRVIVDNKINQTFVYDEKQMADTLYEFFCSCTFDNFEKKPVRFEEVAENGDIIFTKSNRFNEDGEEA